MAEDNDDDIEEMLVEAAIEFVDRFDAYSKSIFTWAHPSYFNSALVQGRDMAIFLGHGNYNSFRAGPDDSDGVDLSQIAFGNFSWCNYYTDLEYLILFSCLTLSLDDRGGHNFWWYWFNNHSNRLEKRPFMGLHQVLGIASEAAGFTYTCCSDDGDDFFGAFADYLDCGIPVRLAWLYAIINELTVENGVNQGAVFFLEEYEYDSFWHIKDDYIHGSPKYDGQAIADHIVVY